MSSIKDKQQIEALTEAVKDLANEVYSLQDAINSSFGGAFTGQTINETMAWIQEHMRRANELKEIELGIQKTEKK